jgi:hypothetical protein
MSKVYYKVVIPNYKPEDQFCGRFASFQKYNVGETSHAPKELVEKGYGIFVFTSLKEARKYATYGDIILRVIGIGRIRRPKNVAHAFEDMSIFDLLSSIKNGHVFTLRKIMSQKNTYVATFRAVAVTNVIEHVRGSLC